jgi:ATP-dependent DNA ligase
MLSNRLRRGAQRADGRVRLLTRKGINFASRFSLVVAALTVLPVRSCLIDGEAVVCNEAGSPFSICFADIVMSCRRALRVRPTRTRRQRLAALLTVWPRREHRRHRGHL